MNNATQAMDTTIKPEGAINVKETHIQRISYQQQTLQNKIDIAADVLGRIHAKLFGENFREKETKSVVDVPYPTLSSLLFEETENIERMDALIQNLVSIDEMI